MPLTIYQVLVFVVPSVNLSHSSNQCSDEYRATSAKRMLA